MTKTFAEKIAEQEREDSDGPLYERPEGVTVEIDDVRPAEKKKRQKKSVQKKPVSEKENEPVEKPVEKPKRAPSAYNLFVKECYKREEVQKLPPKERFSKVAQMWQQEKKSK